MLIVQFTFIANSPGAQDLINLAKHIIRVVEVLLGDNGLGPLTISESRE